MTERKLNFVGAGEQDISEVIIDSESHAVSTVRAGGRVTYTVSYPVNGQRNPLTLEESFAEAAKAIVDDANSRGVEPGKP